MRSNTTRWLCTAGLSALFLAASPLSAAEFDRTVLPIAEPQLQPVLELDARNVTPPPRFQVTAPEGAPNVVIVLLDDLGFGGPSTFGGPLAMPTLDALAADGLRYNNFHTTALCSPTRVALKTGRNHHTANAGSIMETATAFPGDTGQIPNAVAPLAEILRLNGYGTAAFGKWHELAPWEASPAGPFDRWPTLQGFDKFYGFLGGETNQWSPTLYDGVARVHVPADPEYHFTTDMTDKAIEWLRYQEVLAPERPFFLYYAPGAVHAPHHVPAEWADRYEGAFDQGWDKVREETLQRQLALGVVPAGTELAGKPEAIKDWAALSDDERRLFIRQAEVFAGFTSHTDNEVGRLVAALEEMGELDNTLFIYIAGDNGTSAEGGPIGMYNEMSYFNGVAEDIASLLPKLKEWGGPTTYSHMAAGWAVAFNAPFMWTKQVASSFGGTRNGMVIHWPAGFAAKGEVRSQFHHVVDIAQTILEAAGIPEPREVKGTPQIPMEGVSLAYTFEDAAAADRHLTQYFEIFGNRAIYHDGWLAGTVHKAPWEGKPRHPLQEDVWELYDVRSDFSLARDLAAGQPEKLAEMQTLFMQVASLHNVLPLDDRVLERLVPELVGRPQLMAGATSVTLYPGMEGFTENTFMQLKNRSLTLTAELEVPAGGAQGVIISQGGRFGGWALYLENGKPAYSYNFLGLETFTVAAPEALPEGKATVVLDFAYDGGGMGKGGLATLLVNGNKVAEARIERTQPFIFSADETLDVGVDDATPVVEAFGTGREATRFTGTLDKLMIEVR